MPPRIDRAAARPVSYPAAELDRRFYAFAIDRLLAWSVFAGAGYVAYRFLFERRRGGAGVARSPRRRAGRRRSSSPCCSASPESRRARPSSGCGWCAHDDGRPIGILGGAAAHARPRHRRRCPTFGLGARHPRLDRGRRTPAAGAAAPTTAVTGPWSSTSARCPRPRTTRRRAAAPDRQPHRDAADAVAAGAARRDAGARPGRRRRAGAAPPGAARRPARHRAARPRPRPPARPPRRAGAAAAPPDLAAAAAGTPVPPTRRRRPAVPDRRSPPQRPRRRPRAGGPLAGHASTPARRSWSRASRSSAARPEPRGGEPVRHLVPLRSTRHVAVQDPRPVPGRARRRPGGDGPRLDQRVGRDPQGVSKSLTAGRPATLLDGDTVRFGDRTMTVSSARADSRRHL